MRTNKKAIKTAFGMTAFGVTTGLGAQAVSKSGGDAGGLVALSSFAPAMGTIAGAGITMGMLKNLTLNTKNQKRR